MVLSQCPQSAWKRQKPQLASIPVVKQGLILRQEAEESTEINELNVQNKLLVESILQTSKKLRLYNLV